MTSSGNKGKGYKKISVESRPNAAVISFARPEVRNAFDIDVLRELRAALKNLRNDPDLRSVVLTGEGTSFCAGADIAWMKKSLELDRQENLAEARELSDCLYDLYSFPVPVIAAVNGPAMGGGVGFLAASDIAVAAKSAFFAFSEVRVGVVPACISPYVLKRVGEAKTRELFLTGDRITAGRALEIGLVNLVADENSLWDAVDGYIEKIAKGAPGAVAASKELIRNVAGISLKEAKEYTAQMIADLRASAEGQEGLRAFLEKRKPRWQP
jgi:methylglutaconyl-CoA hydratase